MLYHFGVGNVHLGLRPWFIVLPVEGNAEHGVVAAALKQERERLLDFQEPIGLFAETRNVEKGIVSQMETLQGRVLYHLLDDVLHKISRQWTAR